MTDWKEETKQQTLGSVKKQLNVLLGGAPDEQKKVWEKEFEGFEQLFTRYLRSEGSVQWSKIEKVGPETVRPYSALKLPETANLKDLLNKLVVVKLNGGLGTSMGCKGPKSLISVRNDLTFLDLTMQQIQYLNKTYGAEVPLVLMNSFNTDIDTAKVLPKYKQVQVDVHQFNQSRYPRIDKETYQPVASSITGSNLEDWYPPGHGDFYQAFANSGLLDKFLAAGKEYVFVSNIDNMGATVDLNILNYLLTDDLNGGKQPEFLMEVTDKTRADVKGGTLIKYEGAVRLLEIAQVPKDHVDEFKSIQKFSIFNTNNLWAKLAPIKQLVDSKKMEMEIIVNPKHLDSGVDVIQLETAAGAAIKNFQNACGWVSAFFMAVNVPRDRFLPVKKSQDLLLLMSNLYDINNGTLTLSKQRQFSSTPLVKLGTSFDKVHSFLTRFQGVPDLLELDHLTVSGDVTFGKSVTLKGTVIIIANHGERIDIPMGSFLENKIVSGNLRILDH